MREFAARSRLGVVALLGTLGSACTFEDGTGFATVRSAELRVSFEPGARGLEGAVLTNSGYQVRLDNFSAELESFELEELTSDARTSFDPANPPPGYTLCHGGHCHAVDGRLIAYADVEAELADGGPSLSAVATFPIGTTADLLAGELFELDAVEPSRELPRANLRKTALSIARVELSGSVSGGPANLDETPLSVTAPGARPTGPAELEISRDGPAELRFDALLSVDGTLFDDIDWAALVMDGEIVVDPASPVAETFATTFSNNEIELSFR
jgi:hypothetical protein